jgi:hypothetical protein
MLNYKRVDGILFVLIPKKNMLPTKTHGFPPYVPFIQVWECGMWGA